MPRIVLFTMIAFLSLLPGSIAAEATNGPEAKARQLFVEAAQLRRTGPCEQFVVFNPDAGYSRIPWSLFPEIGRFPQLRPLYPALSELGGYDDTTYADLLACLDQWRAAAVKEQRLLDTYPGTEIAVDLVRQDRRLMPADVRELITYIRERYD